MWMDTIKLVGVIVALGILVAGQGLTSDDVVDFSHLYEEFTTQADAGKGTRDTAPVAATPAVNPDLVARVAELEQLLHIRDRQIAELKDALEDATTEFGATVAEMRSQRGADQAGEVRQLREELTEANAMLESLRVELTEANGTQESLRAEQSTLEQARDEAAQLRTELLESKAMLESLHADQAAWQKATEESSRLRSDVFRLEAALQVARTENERERFLLAYNSGALFLAAGRYDRAEQELLKALAIRENDAPLHYNLGILYDEHLRQPAKARRHYERFLALAPNDRDAPVVMQWLRELR